MTNTERKTNLEKVISGIAGQPVALTIRGLKSFTFSTDEVTADLGEKISGYFGKMATVTVDHDEECGSFAYVEVAA